MEGTTTEDRNRSDVPRRRRRLRRWLCRLAIGLLVLVLLAAGAAFVGYRTLLPHDQLRTTEPGDLVIGIGASGTHRAGQLQVSLGDGGRVEVRASTAGDPQLLWTNQPGRAFLTAATGEVSWEEHRGYFWPEVSLDRQWTDQRIDLARVEGPSVVLEGTLLGDEESVPYEVRLRARATGGATVEVAVADDVVDAVGFVSGRTEGAGVHGFGEQFDDFDLSGRLVPIIDREQGVGRGAQPLTLLADVTQHGAGGTAAMTYAALPTFVTDDLRGVSLAPDSPTSTAFAVADTRDPQRVGLEVWARELSVELSAGPSPKSLVAQMHGDTEYPPLAEWTQRGLVVGVQGGTARVREVVARLQQADVRLAGVWIQDWVGQRTTSFGDRLWWTWQLDTERYPRWSRLVADLREQGIRTTTYVNPFLVDSGDRPGRNLWAEARDLGHLVHHPDGSPYQLDQGGFSAALVDLTDPEARDWYAQVIARYVLADGVEGFMADFAEGLPMDARLHEGDPRLLHNRWPLFWAQTVRQACELAGKPDCVTWFRAGSPGMAELTPMFWNGDQLVTYGHEDGLASALLGTFSAGVSGWPLVHSDLGGYTSVDAKVRDYVRSPELLQRWGEVAAFGPMLRSHEGNRPDENRQVYDEDELEATARNSQIFAALRPYRERVLAEAYETGVPVVRHGWFRDPAGEVAQHDGQFFLGDALLVAPVLEEGADAVEVTFPPGSWVHLFTGTRYRGDRTTTIEAPLGKPAAFMDAEDPRTPLVLEQFREAGLLKE